MLGLVSPFLEKRRPLFSGEGEGLGHNPAAASQIDYPSTSTSCIIISRPILNTYIILLLALNYKYGSGSSFLHPSFSKRTMCLRVVCAHQLSRE
jgi:hypothetical protein